MEGPERDPAGWLPGLPRRSCKYLATSEYGMSSSDLLSRLRTCAIAQLTDSVTGTRTLKVLRWIYTTVDIGFVCRQGHERLNDLKRQGPLQLGLMPHKAPVFFQVRTGGIGSWDMRSNYQIAHAMQLEGLTLCGLIAAQGVGHAAVQKQNGLTLTVSLTEKVAPGMMTSQGMPRVSACPYCSCMLGAVQCTISAFRPAAHSCRHRSIRSPSKPLPPLAQTSTSACTSTAPG